MRRIAASSRLVAVVRADIADALRRAASRLVELTDDCWQGSRRVGSGTATGAEYVEQVGPWSSITLQFGEISAAEPWISIDSTWPGEYGRRYAGNGYVQVFTHDEPAEQKARWKLEAAASLSNAARRLEHDAEATPPWLTEAECQAIKRSTATIESLSLDGEPVGFCVLRALGVTAASANFVDWTVTMWGRFDPVDLRLQTVADLDRYLR
jgi:hypothetical protein